MLEIMQYFIPFYGWVVYHCVNMPHFIYSLVDGHMGSFYFHASVSNANMNTHTNFCGTYAFMSLEYVSRRKIAGWYVYYMFTSVKNCLTLFQSSCIIFLSHQQHKISTFLCPCQLLYYFYFYFTSPSGYDVVSHGGFDSHFPNE